MAENESKPFPPEGFPYELLIPVFRRYILRESTMCPAVPVTLSGQSPIF